MLHGVFLLFTRVGRWQVRIPERGLHIYLPVLSRDWQAVPIDECLYGNSFWVFFDLCLLTCSFPWKVGDSELFRTKLKVKCLGLNLLRH